MISLLSLHNPILKTYFSLLFLFVACCVFGQGDRTRYTIDYSMHLSDAAAHGPREYFESGLAHNAFIKVELASRRTSRFTIGAGFLQSKLISNYFDPHPSPAEYIESHHYIDFLVIPVGIKCTFGSFYLHPEIAASYNYRTLTNSYLLDSEMNRPNEPFDIDLNQSPFEVLFASLMTIGFEIKAGSISVLTGAKGYFAFSDYFVNTFGVGLMVGLKI